MRTAKQSALVRMFFSRRLRYRPAPGAAGEDRSKRARVRELRREYARDVDRYGRVLARSVMHSHGRPCAYRQLESMGELAWEPPK